MVSITLLQLTSIFFPGFLCFPFILFLFPFFLVGLEYCTLKSLEHFSFNSVRWGGSWYFRPSSRGGLANFTPIAGVGHLISEPKFKIPIPPPPLLISDKSLMLFSMEMAKMSLICNSELGIFRLIGCKVNGFFLRNRQWIFHQSCYFLIVSNSVSIGQNFQNELSMERHLCWRCCVSTN